MQRFFEKLDNLFEVKQTKYTGKRLIVSFILVVLAVMSMPLYFMYEDHVYEGYLEEYQMASQLVNEYVEIHGEYPLGERVVLEEERDLNRFFNELNTQIRRELYYIDIELLPQLNDFKYTFIIDPNNKFLYTSESVIYRMRRWNFATR